MTFRGWWRVYDKPPIALMGIDQYGKIVSEAAIFDVGVFPVVRGFLMLRVVLKGAA